jgi:hypothetical protein
MDDAKLTAHLRLFGLLALLVPLFVGLQYVVREGVPRVEVRLVAQDIQTTVPVEVPVERVVERVVYVPVDRQVANLATEGTESTQTSLPSVIEAEDQPDAQVGSGPAAEEASRDADVPAPAAVAEPSSTTPPLTGTVALAPPAPAPVIAAPVVAARAAPVYVPPAAEVFAEEAEADEMVAEAEAPEGTPEDGQEIAEAEAETTEEVAVLQFVSEAPMAREDDGASIAMLRHELSVRERKPAPVEEAAVEEPAPMATADETEPADDDGIAGEPEASEPVDDGETVSEAAPISSEELLAQAPSIRTEVLDQGANNEQSLGVLEGQLVARPAGPAPAAENEDGAGPEPVAEGEDEEVVATAEGDEPGEADAPTVADAPVDVDEATWSEGEDGAGEEPIASEVGDAPDVREVARTDDGPGIEDEPEQ